MEWSQQTGAADWWIARLRSFHDHVVGSIVPSGFEAVTRVFHPIEDDGDGTLHRWTDVALANGRVPHAEMQLHRIVSKPGDNRDFQDVPWVEMGHLPTAERRALGGILRRSGANAPTWFGYSDIDNIFPDGDTDNLPTAGTSSRQYHLIRSTLDAIDDVSRFAVGATRPEDEWQAKSPSLWWPEDQSWFVVSEVDFTWTYVAGPNTLIEAIESSPDLEALRSDYTHHGHVDSDKLNGP